MAEAKLRHTESLLQLNSNQSDTSESLKRREDSEGPQGYGGKSPYVSWDPDRLYWRIGNEFYDLEPFLDDHPGGRHILIHARGWFEDHTYAFEAYHHDYRKVRRMMEKFRVSDEIKAKLILRDSKRDPIVASVQRTPVFHSEVQMREMRMTINKDTKKDKITTQMDENENESEECSNLSAFKPHRFPDLCKEDSFYCVLRNKVKKHFVQRRREIESTLMNWDDLTMMDKFRGWLQLPHTEGYLIGPTNECVAYFWCCVAVWSLCFFGGVIYHGSLWWTLVTGVLAAWLGGFGHNWIHQSRYRGYAFVLDVIGMNSEAWARDHNIQHHMYTNTPLDNHYEGTAPFLVTDPTSERNWFQEYVSPTCLFIVLYFGVIGNYIIDSIIAGSIVVMKHLKRSVAAKNGDPAVIAAVKRSTSEPVEVWPLAKLILPLQFALAMYRWGPAWGFFMIINILGVESVYYFTIALANHNTETDWDMEKRAKVRDWAEFQLAVSSDIEIYSGFYYSIKYLWLNYHTIHHLFPAIDMSHHMAIQRLLIDTAQEFDLEYSFYDNIWDMVEEIKETFRHPRAFAEEIKFFPA